VNLWVATHSRDLHTETHVTLLSLTSDAHSLVKEPLSVLLQIQRQPDGGERCSAAEKEGGEAEEEFMQRRHHAERHLPPGGHRTP